MHRRGKLRARQDRGTDISSTALYCTVLEPCTALHCTCNAARCCAVSHWPASAGRTRPLEATLRSDRVAKRRPRPLRRQQTVSHEFRRGLAKKTLSVASPAQRPTESKPRHTNSPRTPDSWKASGVTRIPPHPGQRKANRVTRIPPSATP